MKCWMDWESAGLTASRCVSSVGEFSSSIACIWRSLSENELKATKRVYSHPMFKQNLATAHDQRSRTVCGRQPDILSKSSAELSPRFCRPPVPRHDRSPHDANCDGHGAMVRDIEHRYVSLANIVAR